MPTPPIDQPFYEHYHQKNRPFTKVISANNFTYFFHLRALKPFLPQISRLTVLDVGCGVGTLSLYLAAQGAHQVLGLDLSARAIALARGAQVANHLTNLTFHQGQLTPTLGHFNLIIASEILEHVPDPKTFISDLYANLKPGGTLLLSTPYAHNWLRDHGHMRNHDAVAGHLKIYDEKSLQKLLFTPERQWQLVSLEKVEGPMRTLLFTTPLGELIRVIKGPLVPLFHAVDHILAKWWGWHDMVVKVEKSLQKKQL